MVRRNPKLVIDTNVLITTIYRKNPEFAIYQSFEKKDFDWIVSTEILTEYAEQLTDFYSEATAHLVLDILCTATNVVFAEPHFRWGLIQEDPDDNKFSDLAISTSVDALITFDKHFNVFKSTTFPPLRILHPSEFIAFINQTFEL